MIQKIKTGLTLFVLSLISIGALAQDQKKTPHRFPPWVSEKGYWVVESNINTPLNHVVSFYNNDNVLMYKKTLAGQKLDPGNRKVKMKLKKVLESAVLAWEQKGKNNRVNADELVLSNDIPW